jgi:hypothetical protein
MIIFYLIIFASLNRIFMSRNIRFDFVFNTSSKRTTHQANIHMTFLKHLIVLIYKNLLLKARKPLNTLLELSLPVQLILIIWLFTTLGFNTPKQTSHFKTIPPIRLCDELNSLNACNKKIAITIMDNASGSIRRSIPFVQDYLQQKVNLKVDILESNDQYLKNYKQYVTS